MKKIFAILMTICLLAGALSITAFAAEAPAEGVVLSVSAQKRDGTIVPIENGNFKNFEEGWEAAVDYAEDKDTMKNNGYDRIVVDFYTDWTANEDGEFGDSGDGFEWSTIHITEDIRITLNLNNHTINRNLKEWEYDGEVIYIDDNADVIINNGTITGGWSCNGAGGIHMQDDSKLTLNNVNIVGNTTDDDDGAGIAAYDGAVLVMNGGSISDNKMLYAQFYRFPYGSLYVNNAPAMLNNVTISNNRSESEDGAGVAIYADNSTVTLNDCVVSNNGITDNNYYDYAESIIGGEDSTIIITNTDFIGNFSTTNDCSKGMQGFSNSFANESDFFFQQETSSCRQEMSYAFNGSMRTMGHTKTVVNIQICQRSKLFSKVHIVLFFFFMVAQVFQKQELTSFQIFSSSFSSSVLSSSNL